MNTKKLYLIAYNSAHAIGWALVLGAFLFQSISNKGFSGEGIYSTVACALSGLQLVMSLDDVHAIVKLVQSPPLTVAMQIASRVFVVLILHQFVASRSCVGLSMILIAWCPTEVIRYTYYVLRTLGKSDSALPPQLIWLRYSSFIVLYPTGVFGELTILWSSLRQVSADPFWHPLSILIYVIIFAIYPVGFYVLYTYMLSQRKKNLNVSSVIPPKKIQ